MNEVEKINKKTESFLYKILPFYQYAFHLKKLIEDGLNQYADNDMGKCFDLIAYVDKSNRIKLLQKIFKDYYMYLLIGNKYKKKYINDIVSWEKVLFHIERLYDDKGTQKAKIGELLSLRYNIEFLGFNFNFKKNSICLEIIPIEPVYHEDVSFDIDVYNEHKNKSYLYYKKIFNINNSNIINKVIFFDNNLCFNNKFKLSNINIKDINYWVSYVNKYWLRDRGEKPSCITRLKVDNDFTFYEFMYFKNDEYYIKNKYYWEDKNFGHSSDIIVKYKNEFYSLLDLVFSNISNKELILEKILINSLLLEKLYNLIVSLSKEDYFYDYIKGLYIFNIIFKNKSKFFPISMNLLYYSIKDDSYRLYNEIPIEIKERLKLFNVKRLLS